jgi:hypothetical protein
MSRWQCIVIPVSTRSWLPAEDNTRTGVMAEADFLEVQHHLIDSIIRFGPMPAPMNELRRIHKSQRRAHPESVQAGEATLTQVLADQGTHE